MRPHTFFRLSSALVIVLALATPAAHAVRWDAEGELLVAGPDEQIFSTARTAEGQWVAGVRQRESRQELALWQVTDGRVRSLTPPRGQRDLLRSEPVLLARQGRLSGIAWLEGNRSNGLAVYWSSLSNGSWSEIEKVAAPGPGSQVALAGALLEDGSVLLTWAAFDGTDDEIMWSMSRGTGLWSEPKRLNADNQVPDVTPAVVAVDGGALALWSAFDGDQYRLFSSRYDGRRWSEAQAAAPPGSLFPTIDPESRMVVYRSAAPRGWGTFAVNPQGRMQNRAVIASPQAERPRIEGDPTGELRWRFADGSTAALRHEVLAQ